MKPGTMLHLGRLMVEVGGKYWEAYATVHGPRFLPWWRPVRIAWVRCGTGHPAWNVWTYTRWGTWCNHVAIKPRGHSLWRFG